MLHNLVPANSDLMTRLIHFQQLKNFSSCFLVLLPLLWEAIALWLWLTVLLPVTCCLLPGVLRVGMGGQGEAVHSGNLPTNWKKDNAVSEKLLHCCGCVLWEWRSLERRSAIVTEYDLSECCPLELSQATALALGWRCRFLSCAHQVEAVDGRAACLLVCCWGDKCFVVTVFYLLTKQGHKHGIFTEPLEVKSRPSYFTRQWRNQSPESGINLTSGTVFSTCL